MNNSFFEMSAYLNRGRVFMLTKFKPLLRATINEQQFNFFSNLVVLPKKINNKKKENNK